jgi:hypothetical protein
MHVSARFPLMIASCVPCPEDIEQRDLSSLNYDNHEFDHSVEFKQETNKRQGEYSAKSQRMASA